MVTINPGFIACIAISAVLTIIIVGGCIMCHHHKRIGNRVRQRRELQRRCRSLIRKQEDMESLGSGDFSAGSCSGCSDSECWGRYIHREKTFGSTLAVPETAGVVQGLAVPTLAYDPERGKDPRVNDKEVLSIRMADREKVGGW